MKIWRTVFLLLLYIALAWVVVFLYYGDQGLAGIVRPGLFWTAAGIAAVLLFYALHHLWQWWTAWRTRARSTAPKPTDTKRHEDDVAFAGLIAEADGRLSRAPGAALRSIRDLPLYLLVGPEGSGKTSLIRDAGVDAKLLAGQVDAGSGRVTGTRVANIWLIGDDIFIEIGARVFQGDTGRLREFLGVLVPPSVAGWRAVWNGPRRAALNVRGVVYCCSVRPFGKEPDRATIEQAALTARDRLLTISDVFGIRVPVYWMFTNADAIEYFGEYFGRMSGSESSQPLGALVPLDGEAAVIEGQVWADSATRKLSRDFNALFLRLAARRVIALSQESDGGVRPAIYEFPREFRKLRNSIVQYLVDCWRPDPLVLSPLPRGFFFCGRRRVKVAVNELPTDTQTRGQSPEATVIFRPDSTRVIEPLTAGEANIENAVFTHDFFHKVLASDRPALAQRARVSPQLTRKRRIALVLAAALGAVLTLAWTVSWARNRSLVKEVTRSVADSRISGRNPLQSLDTLRRVLVDRLEGPNPISMSWGLYTGEDLREGVRSAYFRRLGQLLLSAANERLLEGLNKPGDYDTAYRQLKTQLTISRSACPVDARLLADTLQEAVAAVHPEMDQELVRKQIDYYVATLARSGSARPLELRQDLPAVQHAREYLISKQGPEQMLAALLAELRRTSANFVVPASYRKVMSAPEWVAFEFTREGREKFEQLADSGKFDLTAEACVFGNGNRFSQANASAEEKRAIRSSYYRLYADAWKGFLSKVSFRGYAGLADAVVKLDVLSSPASPLLGLIKLTAENTHFVAPPASQQAGSKLAEQLKKAGKAVEKAKAAAQASGVEQNPEFAPTNLDTLFQPAHLTVQPDAPNLVTEKNKGYVDALRALQVALDSLNRQISATDPTHDSLIDAAQTALTQALSAEKNLADGFFQNTEEVDKHVSEILLQPLLQVRPLLPKKKTPGEGITESVRKTCRELEPKLSKYPLDQKGNAELSLTELSSAFAPATGEVWQIAKLLGPLVMKNGRRWESGPPAGGAKASQEAIDFLNRSQDLTDAFFPGGGTNLKLEYTLRPITSQTSRLKLQIDGKTIDADSALRQGFEWPASDAIRQGAEGVVLAGGQEFGFAKYPGLWGVFRLFRAADARPLMAQEVTWSQTSGIGALPQPLKPPVKVQILTFPGGIDVLNPAFFSRAVTCPVKAVVTE